MSDKNAEKVRDYYSQPRFVEEPEFATDPIVAHEQECRRDAIASLLDDGSLALDAGCGNGRNFEMLASHAGSVIGVDFSPDALKMARYKTGKLANGKADVLTGDLTRLPFKDGRFDLIVCVEVLEHIPGWRQAVREFHRLLKPGGSLIISTPNKLSMYGLTRYASRLLIKSENPYDEWKSYFELKKALTGAGFALTDIRGVAYLPGDLSYYQPFRWLVTHLLGTARFLQKALTARWPFHSLGYSIVVKGKKVTGA